MKKIKKGAAMSVKKTIDILRVYGSFLITTHINPEGDSLGSQLALYQLLERMGKKAVMINDHKVPAVYEFLPQNNLIRTRLEKNIDYDVAIAVDCPTLERIGRVKEIIRDDRIILNIDHHISNVNFGKVNWIEANASSCGEMIYSLFKELDCKIDKDIAINIYTAILTDTGSFGYNNTSSRTHSIASELLGYGLDVSDIHEKIYEKKSISEMKLLGMALLDVKTEENGKIAYVVVTQDMANACDNFDLKGTESFVNFPRAISGVEIALFFREEKAGSIHVSFRSKGKVDVYKLAQVFGGGGHARASGCLVKGKLDEVKEQVLAEVRKEAANF